MRLIDADFVKQRINETMSSDYVYATRRIKNLIDNAPTIDAVEVVRCKDCKYYESRCDYPFCYYTENNVETDDYCSFGEKKEVEG